MKNKMKSSALLSGEDQNAYKGLLTAAFDVARDFDGSEASLHKVVDAFNEADQFVRARTGGAHDMNIQADFEKAFAGEAGFFAHSIGQMLVDTTAHFYHGLRDDVFAKLKAGGAAIVDTGRVFVPTQGGEIFAPSTENPDKFEIRTEPRLAWLVEDLKAIGIYTDDLIVHRGTVRPNMVRQEPYVVVDIPRLNRQIAVCDQVGEITFVSDEILDPRVYEECNKDILKGISNITAIAAYNRDYWRQGIAAALMTNARKPKLDVQAIAVNPPQRSYPLTVAMIVEKAQEFFNETGLWPNKYRGSEWASVNRAIMNRRRGLGDQGLPEHVCSLTSFLEWQGFVISNISPAKYLTVAGIVEKANSYHAQHGAWPMNKTDDEWKAIDNAVRRRLRGLSSEKIPEHVKGIASLFEWKELTISLFSEARDLTVDAIVEKAKAHHEATGKWPLAKISLEWQSIYNAVINRGRGLDKADIPDHVKTLPLLLEWKGLTISRFSPTKVTTVSEIVEKAKAYRESTGEWPAQDTNSEWRIFDKSIARRKRGLDKAEMPDHVRGIASFLEWQGLMVSRFSPSKNLTVDMIIEKAKAYHEETGRWPKGSSGEEWAGIDSALHGRHRGLDKKNLPDEVRGVTSFLEWKGLTVSHMSPSKKLTIEAIVNKAQTHFEKTRQWPTVGTNDEWRVTNGAIGKRLRGLSTLNIPDHVKGLASFLEWKGLKVSNHSSSKHLTAAGIFEKARAYQADPQNNGQWPTHSSNQEWTNINAALKKRLRGLAEENLPDHVISLYTFIKWQLSLQKPAGPEQGGGNDPGFPVPEVK